MGPESGPKQDKDFSNITPEQLDARWSEQVRKTQAALQQITEDVTRFANHLRLIDLAVAKRHLIEIIERTEPDLSDRVRRAKNQQEVIDLAVQVFAASTRRDLEDTLAEMDRRYGITVRKAPEESA